MNRIFFIFSLVFGSLLAQGQDAKTLLDAVSKKFKGYKTVEASFTFKNLNSSGKVLSTKKGTLKLKGTKYRVSMAGQEIFCDGKNVWSYDKNTNEVTITQFDNSSSTITPQRMFTNFYDKDFNYKLNGTKTLEGKTGEEIELTPKNATKSLKKVFVIIDKAASTILATKVIEKNNNQFIYVINSMKSNTSISDNTFVFDKSKYPGVEENDLR
jgi:outer membrane lipoprotein carrier protein